MSAPRHRGDTYPSPPPYLFVQFQRPQPWDADYRIRLLHRWQFTYRPACANMRAEFNWFSPHWMGRLATWQVFISRQGTESQAPKGTLLYWQHRFFGASKLPKGVRADRPSRLVLFGRVIYDGDPDVASVV